MKISMRTIAICVSMAALAACSGQAAVPESAASQTQAVGAHSRPAAQPPATYKITVENLTQRGWTIVARGFRHSCIQSIDPATDQRLAYGAWLTFTIRTGDLNQCPVVGMDHLASATINLLLEDGRTSSPQQQINLMEFVGYEADLSVFEPPWPFGGVMCVHPTDFENGREHVIKPNENVHLTFRVC